jgi:tetratricopeptide (TPR) repeat protein
LFQHYVYNQLDEVARVHLHCSVAEALEGLRLKGEAEVQGGVQDPTAPVRLAWHWEAAGRFDRAATHLLEAGKRAEQLSAYEEAVQLLRRGLALLERLPEGSERAQLEKQLLISLIHPLTPSQGWASAERAQLAQRARDLERHGPTSEADLIGALYLQGEILNAQGNHAESRELAELFLHLAQRSENPAYLGLGYYALGASRFFSGDLAGGASDFRQALDLYDRREHARFLPWTEGDLGVRCLSLLAMGLCYMGCADQGRFCSQQALALAKEVAEPLTEGVAVAFAGCSYHALCHEISLTQGYARRLMDLSEQKRLPMFRSYGLIYQGWAQVLSGAGAPAIGRMRQGLAEWRAMGHQSGTPFLLALLVEALQHSGAWDEALSSVEEGLALAVEIDAPHRPDLYRLKGDLLVHSPAPAGTAKPSDQAEACFHTAIAEARQNGSKLFELRAMTSLARLWADQDKRAEAHLALAEIYNSFSEGFDTCDLRAAKALLDELEAGRPASSAPYSF